MRPGPAPLPHQKLWSLEVFRGLCALVVFLSHWQSWCLFPATTTPERLVNDLISALKSGFDFLTWNTGGNHPAVIAFMVLSGYCIHHARIRRSAASPCGNDSAPWLDYLRRRAIRILPVYWAGAALGLLFVALQAASPAAHSTLAFYAQATPIDAVVRMLGLASFYPRELLAGNGPLNYVSAELVVYLLYPLLFVWMRPRAWAWLFALGLLGQAAAYGLARTLDPFWAFNSPLMMGLFWLMGAALADARHRGRVLPAKSLLVASWGAFFLLRELVATFPARNLLLQLLWALTCLALISLTISTEERRPALGTHPLTQRLRRLGLASYSLYVVHAPALFLSGWLLLHLLPAPTYGLQMAAGLASTVALTALCYFFVEAPCLRLVSRRSAPPDTPAAPSAPAPRPSPAA